jgi:hypothetical protein
VHTSRVAHTTSELLDALAGLLVGDPTRVSSVQCSLTVSFGTDSGYVRLHGTPSTPAAQATMKRSGNQFTAPKQQVHVQSRDRAPTLPPPPAFDPPIISTESLPDIGDENFVWRGYNNNSRGFIRLRVGFLVDINAPSVAEAEGLARHVNAALRESSQ